jgi:eukaryotic-like serine/threonine-protein kinase
MELLRGITLDDRVMAQGALPVHETVEHMRQIAAGLDKAHGHVDASGRPTPIVHRDLKPSNIFLTQRDDGSPLLKILDFGAAKVLSPTTKASGVVRGTPQFMANEQALGEPSTEATDVWAFGLIAFYLLTGRSYWLTVEQDGTQAQLFAELLHRPLAPASQRARQLGVSVALSSEFDVWFSRCVNRDPAQRFTSAGLAASELARVLGIRMEPLTVNELPPRLPTAWQSAVPAVSRRSSELETQELAVLSSTPGSTSPSRRRVGLVMLAIVLAGTGAAAALFVQKRAAVGQPAPSALSASPAPAVSLTLPPATNPAPATEPSSAPISARPLAPAPRGSQRPRPTSSPRADERGASETQSKAPVKTTAPTRDPYERR